MRDFLLLKNRKWLLCSRLAENIIPFGAQSPTLCDVVQRFNLLYILHKHRSEQVLQFITAFTQQFVEVTNRLLIGAYVRSCHLR